MSDETDSEQPLNLPVFEEPLNESRPNALSWKDVMRETEAVRRYYIEHYDSPERRLASKNPEPFRL